MTNTLEQDILIANWLENDGDPREAILEELGDHSLLVDLFINWLQNRQEGDSWMELVREGLLARIQDEDPPERPMWDSNVKAGWLKSWGVEPYTGNISDEDPPETLWTPYGEVKSSADWKAALTRRQNMLEAAISANRYGSPYTGNLSEVLVQATKDQMK